AWMKSTIAAILAIAITSCTPSEIEREAAEYELSRIALDIGYAEIDLANAETPGAAAMAGRNLDDLESRARAIMESGDLDSHEAEVILLTQRGMAAVYRSRPDR